MIAPNQFAIQKRCVFNSVFCGTERKQPFELNRINLSKNQDEKRISINALLTVLKHL